MSGVCKLIHLTETLAVTLADQPIQPDRTYIRKSLEEYLSSTSGWVGLFRLLSGDSENSEKFSLELVMPDLIRLLCVFVRSIYPSASKDDALGTLNKF